MKPENLQFINIKEIIDTITNVDRPDIREEYARESRGVRITTPGKVLERDFGTIHRFMNYPIRPNAYKKITNATNDTPIQITITGHSYSTNDVVFIGEVGGNTAANGRWVITKIDDDNFTLNDSIGNGIYTSGGICTKTPVEIVRSETIYIKDELKSYHVLFGLDSDYDLHIYIGDEENQTWLELTEVYYGTIKSISGSQVTIENVKDFQGNDADTDIVVNGYFNNWISCLSGAGMPTAAQITTSVLSGSDQVLYYEIYPGSSYGYLVGQTLYLYRCTGILPDEQLGAARGYEFSQGTNPHIRFLEQDSQQKSMVIIGNSSTPIEVRQPLNLRKGANLVAGTFTIGGSSEGWSLKTSGHFTSAFWSHLYGGIFPMTYDIEDMYVLSGNIYVKRTSHPYTDGETVRIEQVQGITEANGTWTISTTADPDWFKLNGVVGSGVYTPGTGKLIVIYFCKYQGAMYRSDDNGVTLSSMSFASTSRSVWIKDYDGYCVGINPKKLYRFQGRTGPWTNVYTFANDIQTIGAHNATDCGIVSNWTYYTYDYLGLLRTKGSLPNSISNEFGQKLLSYDGTNLWYKSYDQSNGDSYIWRSTDGGSNWTRYAIGSGAWIIDFWFIDASNGFASGGNGRLYKTTDGGQTWTSADLGKGALYGIQAYSTLKIRVIIYESPLWSPYYTNDGGSSWTREALDTDPTPLWIYHLRNMNSGSIVNTGDLDENNAFIMGQSTGFRLEGDPGASGTGYNQGWYIDKYGLLPDCKDFGGILNTLLSGTTTENEIGEGIKISIQVSEETLTNDTQYFIRGYITALYTDYSGSGLLQESDPIAQYFLDCSAKNQFPYPTITIYLKPGVINKTIYGFRIYQAWHDNQISSYELWADNPQEYILVKELLLSDIGWTIAEDQPWCIYNIVDDLRYDDISDTMGEAISNIDSNLNHAIDKNREYLSPKFAVKGSRAQGSIIVANEGDDTLRFSSIDGDIVHEDENFPNVSTDNTGNIQRLSLRGTGPILGMAVLRGKVVVFRESEAELYDTQTNTIVIIAIDFYSKDSLVIVGKENPAGIAWSGRSGFYFMPSDGSQIKQLNLRTSNLFDGTLFLSDNVTPYVTDNYRQNVKAGYDLIYHELWFQYQVNKEGGGTEYLCQRFNLIYSKSCFRELNIVDGAVVNFTRKRDDESFVIATKYGLLKYPNRSITANSHAWEDEVRYGGYSSGRGIPTRIKINISKLFRPNLHPQLYDMIIYFKGTGDAASEFNIDLFKNEETSAFDSQTHLITGYTMKRMIAYYGNMTRLDLQISLPSNNLHLIKMFDISEIIISFTLHDRVGNI